MPLDRAGSGEDINFHKKATLKEKNIREVKNRL